jgi:hypothetical protein
LQLFLVLYNFEFSLVAFRAVSGLATEVPYMLSNKPCISTREYPHFGQFEGWAMIGVDCNGG